MKAIFYKYECGNWLDYIINFGTGNLGYSHCEFLFDETHELNPSYDYTKSRCFSISGRENNSRFKGIDVTNGHWDIYQISKEYLKENNLTEKSIIESCKKLTNLKYDYIGIFFGWIIPTGWQISSRWYCSEIMAKVLNKGIIKISPNKLSIDPALTKLKI